MNDLHEIEWLAEQQPEIEPASEIATARARRTLVAYARAEAAQPLTVAAPVAARPRRTRRLLRPARALALAGAAALIVLAGVALDPRGESGSQSPVPAIQSAKAAPLVRLSEAVLAEGAPAGDATLVRRRTDWPDGTGFTAFDLYTDAGPYVWAPTLTGLRKALRAGEDVGEATTARVVAAAAAAVGLPQAEARQRMIDASWAGGHAPSGDQPAPAPADQVAARAAAVASGKLESSPEPPASQRSLDDNRIWFSSMDALVAGAGRRDVRAGALRLLATLGGVTVESGTAPDGTPTLLLRNRDFGNGYEERLTVTERSGRPLHFEGGHPGERPETVVRYRIARVELKDLRAGS